MSWERAHDMSGFLWYSEIALAYLLSSFLVAMVVGRVLRQASQPDMGALELRPVERSGRAHFSRVKTNDGTV